MILTKSSRDIKKVKEFLSDRRSKKQSYAKNFNGKLMVDEDALVIQHRLRDEWN